MMAAAPLTWCPHEAPAAAGSQGEGPWLARCPKHEVDLGASLFRGSGSLGEDRSVFLCGRGVARTESAESLVFWLGWHAVKGGREPSRLRGYSQSIKAPSLAGREGAGSLMPAACLHRQLPWRRGCKALEQALSLIRCGGSKHRACFRAQGQESWKVPC